MYSVRTVGEAGDEPASLDDLKAQLVVQDDEQDVLLARLISAARAEIERRTGMVLRRQTLEIVFDGFGARRALELPRAPISAITELAYIGADAASVVVDPSGYTLADVLGAPTLRPSYAAQVFPSCRADAPVTVTVTAGYLPGEVPPDTVQRLLTLAAHWFRNREAEGVVPKPLLEAILIDRLQWL